MKKQILLIEDQPATRKLLSHYLGEFYTITEKATAEEALFWIKEGNFPDAIVTDILMPEMTGIELHDTLSQTAPDQAARMVFMSGGAFSEEAARFLAQRPGRVIDKPFRPAALRAAVDTALERADAA